MSPTIEYCQQNYGLDKNLCQPLTDTSVEPTKGLGEYFFEEMEKNSTKIAQIDSVTGKKETYGELLSRCIRVAQAMQDRNITEEDIVSFCTLNTMDNNVPLLAALFLGIRISSLDPSSPLNETIHQVKLVKPRIIFCEEESVKLVEDTLQGAGLDTEIIVFGKSDKYATFSDFLISKKPEKDFKPIPKDPLDTMAIFFSSGTTGLPKATCVRGYGIYRFISRFRDFEMGVIATFTSPYWISNIAFLSIGILLGVTRLVCRTFNEKTAVKCLHDYKVNATMFTPINIDRLMQNTKYCQYDTSHLKHTFIGGSQAGATHFLEVFKLFPSSKVYNCYGMTEIGGLMFKFVELDENEVMTTKRATVGKPIDGFCYKIVDPETEEILGPNEPGELRIKYKGVLNGYHTQPELYAKAFDKDGFLMTGDIALYDEEYNFFLVDRLKEIFKFRSWHISPALIENELLTHPDIEHAAVIGIPDLSDGELATAVIVPTETASITEEDVVKYIEGRLHDRYHLRGGVHMVKNLPITPTGKLRRKFLRDMILKQKSLN